MFGCSKISRWIPKILLVRCTAHLHELWVGLHNGEVPHIILPYSLAPLSITDRITLIYHVCNACICLCALTWFIYIYQFTSRNTHLDPAILIHDRCSFGVCCAGEGSSGDSWHCDYNSQLLFWVCLVCLQGSKIFMSLASCFCDLLICFCFFIFVLVLWILWMTCICSAFFF